MANSCVNAVTIAADGDSCTVYVEHPTNKEKVASIIQIKTTIKGVVEVTISGQPVKIIQA